MINLPGTNKSKTGNQNSQVIYGTLPVRGKQEAPEWRQSVREWLRKSASNSRVACTTDRPAPFDRRPVNRWQGNCQQPWCYLWRWLLQLLRFTTLVSPSATRCRQKWTVCFRLLFRYPSASRSWSSKASTGATAGVFHSPRSSRGSFSGAWSRVLT